MAHRNTHPLRSRAAFVLGAGLLCLACTKTPAEPPGVGEQPEQHPERNPATLPTAPAQGTKINAAESPDNPDSLGTTRTPPAQAAQPMDDSDAGLGADGGPDAG